MEPQNVHITYGKTGKWKIKTEKIHRGKNRNWKSKVADLSPNRSLNTDGLTQQLKDRNWQRRLRIMTQL